ncbi:MAG: RluA family pseudouridine synthase [Janthinobacterium lividum]
MYVVNTILSVRLDRYLKRLFPTLTQGTIEQSLRLGKIRVNNIKCLSNFRVNQGDVITIVSKMLTELTNSNAFNNEDRIFSNAAITLAEKIVGEYLIYDDEHFMAINKPAKLATQGGSKISLSLNDGIDFLNSRDNLQLKLVHRLDRETSGILLIAKTYYGASKIASAFEQKIIEKKYLAVVEGSPIEKHGQISSILHKNKDGVFSSSREEVQEEGKLAITLYRVLKNLGNRSLIEFAPHTGRMHQLRVHAKSLGHPIVGDSKYNNFTSSKSNFMLLHSYNLKIPIEIFGKEIALEAELPRYFKDISHRVCDLGLDALGGIAGGWSD